MAETSTGALQPLEGLGCLCRKYEALLLVDAVTGLATSPLFVDAWMIDVCYSCSQKGLSCCPGVSPLTVGPRAIEKIRSRKTPVSNWYLDLSLLMKYWSGDKRCYHHTPPISLLFALREALRALAKEGLENVWRRHKETADFFAAQLQQRGIQLHVQREEYRSPALTTVSVPKGVSAASVAAALLQEGVEIGLGIGQLEGKVWRVGFMGANANIGNAEKLLLLLDKYISKSSTDIQQ